MQYQLNIIGHTWGGFKSTYTYSVDADVLTHPETVKSLAGDFQSVIDYQVISRETKTERNSVSKKTLMTVTTTVVRDWEHADSEDTWAEFEACTA